MEDHMARYSVRPSRPVITQDSLDRYLYLYEKMREYNDLRRKLMKLLDQDAAIEAGPLTAYVEVSWELRLSIRKLKEVLGDELVERYRSQISETKISSLRVVELDE
jgi:hypothetical protein